MAFGLSWTNNSGKVAISSDYYGLAFIGNATFLNTQKPDSYTQLGGGGFGGYLAGVKDPFYIYTITSVYTPVAFIQITANRYRVCSINNVGGNSWEIVVGGNNWTTPPIVKCFARMSGAGVNGFGLRVWDAASNRTWDSVEKMLICKQRDDWSATSNTTTSAIQQTITLTGFTAPYMMCKSEARISAAYNSGTAPNVTVSEYITAFSGSATSLTRQSNGVLCDKYSNDAFTGNSNILVADRTYIIEGSYF